MQTEQETQKCVDCGKDKVCEQKYNGEPLCDDCYDESYFYCERCDDISHNDNSCFVEGYGDMCDSCYNDDFFRCDRCNSDCHNDDYANDGYCVNCVEQNNDNIPFRRYKNTVAYQSKSTAGAIKIARLFGIELEVINEERNALYELANAIPDEIGIAYDGSISGDNGIELQTPQISGTKGEALIKTITNELAKGSFQVNRTCGYHLHIDLKEAIGDLQKIKDIFCFYLAFESVILSFLPKSRRQNTYCLPLSNDYHLKEIQEADCIQDLEAIWYRVQTSEQIKERKGIQKDGSRYKGINMHTLLSDGHLEIRYHSGTTNAKKILEWANLHLTICEMAIQNGFSESALKSASTMVDITEKTNLFFSLIGLSKESEDYFRTRQQQFTTTIPYAINLNSYNTNLAILQSEIEA